MGTFSGGEGQAESRAEKRGLRKSPGSGAEGTRHGLSKICSGAFGPLPGPWPGKFPLQRESTRKDTGVLSGAWSLRAFLK